MDGTPREITQTERKFDPSRTAVSSNAQSLVRRALVRFTGAERRTRARRAADRARHERAFTSLICDLAYSDVEDADVWLMVELSKTALSGRHRRAPFLTEAFADTIRHLASPEVGLIELKTGHYTPFGGVRSTAQSSPLLRAWAKELELGYDDFGRDPDLLGPVLELRAAKTEQQRKAGRKGGQSTLPATPDVARMDRQIRELNVWLGQANLQWSWESPRVDTGNRFLRRVFNNGSLEEGGRLYGGFWQKLSADERLDVMIDGDTVAELDFAQSAVRMAYAEVGVEPPVGDLYRIPRLESYRDTCKKLLNALLSASECPERFPPGTRGDIPKHWHFDHVFGEICRHHEPIMSMFGGANGLRFMYRESEILLDTLFALMARGIVALPIHDAILVGSDHIAVAKIAMQDAFEALTGVPGVVEVQMGGMSLRGAQTDALDVTQLDSPVVGGLRP